MYVTVSACMYNHGSLSEQISHPSFSVCLWVCIQELYGYMCFYVFVCEHVSIYVLPGVVTLPRTVL